MSGGALDPTGLVLLVGLALLALVAAVLSTLLMSRRKIRREIRELVTALEGMRGGRPKHRPDIPEDSALGLVADSVNRLGQDIAARTHEATRVATQLDALHAAAPDTAVVSTDDEGSVRSFNEAAEELFRWSTGDVQGQPASVLFPEDAWKDLLPKLLRRDVRSRGLRTRASLRRKDGTLFEAELFVRSLRHDGAEGGGFLVAVRDIDERVRLERRLARTELRHRELLERLADAVVVLQDGDVAFANPAAVELFDRDEVVGVPFHALVPTREVLRVREWLDRGPTPAGDLPVLRTAIDGSGGPVRVRLRAARIEHEGRPAVLAVLADETATVRLEAEVRRNEARLDAVLDATTDGILVFGRPDGPAGAVAEVTNRAFLELFGLSQELVLGASEGAVLRLLRERGGGAETVAGLIAASAGETLDETVVLEGEAAGEVDVRSAPMRDGSGRVIGRMVACRVRAARRSPERHLEDRGDELRESVGDLRRAYEEAEERNRELLGRAEGLEQFNRELRQLDGMKSQLLANVSHELQTPLVSIRGYTEMISKARLGPVTDEQRRGLELSLRNIDRLISMIDGLLEFSRMEREVGALELSEFDLGDLIEECRETLQPRMEARGLTWSTKIDAPGLRIHADRDKIRQVVLNVLGNAVKFNRNGGRVEVVVDRRDDAHARVEVRDTGPGIPPEDLDRVFERFYRVAEGSAEGTGLGLSIVRSLLRLHGCSVRADSRPGEGATFTFTLPLADPEESRRESDRPPGDEAAVRSPDTADEPAEEPPSPDPKPPPARDRGDRPRLRIIRR